MKLCTKVILAASIAASANAFSPAAASAAANSMRPAAFAPATPSVRFMSTAAPEETDVVANSAMPVAVSDANADPYAQIGISKDQMSIGIDAAEFLQWAGTKQVLIDRFQKDNPEFSEERATEEVERFVMDPEMVNAFLQYEKKMAENPMSFQQEAQNNLKDPNTISTYAAWLIGGVSIGWIRKTFFPPTDHAVDVDVDAAATKAADAVASIASNVAHHVASSNIVDIHISGPL